MHRTEFIEWIVILASIVLWWPRIFLGFDPLWYHLLLYVGVPVTLLVIFFRRLARVRAGFKYSEDSLSNQPPGPRQP